MKVKTETAKWYKNIQLEPEIDTMLNIRYQTVNGSQKQQNEFICVIIKVMNKI